MTEKTTTNRSLKLMLGEDDYNGEVTVSLDSFLLFDNAITHGLDALERRYSDWATPASLRHELWAEIGREA